MNWVLCPVLNGYHLTRVALRTFLAQDIGDVSVLFCDNASTDGTAQLLASQPENVHVMSQQKPLSVAASWNLMLRWAFKQGAEYALVVNNDVELRPETYRLLVNDGGQFVTAVGDSDRERALSGESKPAEKRPHPDYSCFLIRKDCWQRVPFDEAYTNAYCEDGAHHLRMHQAGIAAYCIGVPFYHVAAGTLKNAPIKDVRRIQKAADDNRALFKQRHGVEMGSPEYYALFTSAVPASEPLPQSASGDLNASC